MEIAGRIETDLISDGVPFMKRSPNGMQPVTFGGRDINFDQPSEPNGRSTASMR